MPDFTPLPDARPEHLHDPEITDTHVQVEVTRQLVSVELNELRVLIYRHEGSEGRPYLVIDLDNDLETDQPVDLRIYRNDGVVYGEGAGGHEIIERTLTKSVHDQAHQPANARDFVGVEMLLRSYGNALLQDPMFSKPVGRPLTFS